MTTSSKRFWIGAANGVVATLVMSIAMALVYVIGLMPEPIPLAQLSRITAAVLHQRLVTTGILIVAIPIHLAYGGLWAGLATASTRHVTWWKGLVLGLGLWAIMMVFFLPMSGTQTFALASHAGTWISTLLVHVVYGVTYGVLTERLETRRLPEPP